MSFSRRRLGRVLDYIDDTLTNEGNANERSLAEDGDEFTESFSGKLSFAEEHGGSKSNSPVQKAEETCSSENVSLPFAMEKKFHSVIFEVMNAEIIGEGRSKYVSYSILLVQPGGLDNSPVMIQRRYSDFDRLNTDLRKRLPTLMQDIVFPKKMLIGNFKPQNIAQRSRAFEQFLTHIYSVDLLRLSPEFTSFFYLNDLHQAYTLIQNAKYAEALLLLQSAVKLQRKLLGDTNSEVVATVCAMVCCCDATDQKEMAQAYAELALKCVATDDNDKYLVPLLQLSTHLCWKLGKDKKDLEDRLQDLRKKGINVDTWPSLLELVIGRFSKH